MANYLNPFETVKKDKALQPAKQPTQSPDYLNPYFTESNKQFQNEGYDYVRQLLSGPQKDSVPSYNTYKDVVDLGNRLLEINPEGANNLMKTWFSGGTELPPAFKQLANDWALKAMQKDPSYVEQWMPFVEQSLSAPQAGVRSSLPQMQSDLELASGIMSVNPEKALQIAAQYFPGEGEMLDAQAINSLRNFAVNAVAQNPNSRETWETLVPFLQKYVNDELGSPRGISSYGARLDQAQVNNFLNSLYNQFYYDPLTGQAERTRESKVEAGKNLDLANIESNRGLGPARAGGSLASAPLTGGVLTGNDVNTEGAKRRLLPAGAAAPSPAGAGAALSQDYLAKLYPLFGVSNVFAQAAMADALASGASLPDALQTAGVTPQMPQESGQNLLSQLQPGARAVTAQTAQAAPETAAPVTQTAQAAPASELAPEEQPQTEFESEIDALKRLNTGDQRLTSGITELAAKYNVPRSYIKDVMFGKSPATIAEPGSPGRGLLSAIRRASAYDPKKQRKQLSSALDFISQTYGVDRDTVKDMMYGKVPIGLPSDVAESVPTSARPAEETSPLETTATKTLKQEIKILKQVEQETKKGLLPKDRLTYEINRVATETGLPREQVKKYMYAKNEDEIIAPISTDSVEYLQASTTPDFTVVPAQEHYVNEILTGLMPLDVNLASLDTRLKTIKRVGEEMVKGGLPNEAGILAELETMQQSVMTAYKALRAFSENPTTSGASFNAVKNSIVSSKAAWESFLAKSGEFGDTLFANNLAKELSRSQSANRLHELQVEYGYRGKHETGQENLRFQHEQALNQQQFNLERQLQQSRSSGGGGGRSGGSSGGKSSGSGGSGGGGVNKTVLKNQVWNLLYTNRIPQYKSIKDMKADFSRYGGWMIQNGLATDSQLRGLQAKGSAELRIGKGQAAKDSATGYSSPLYNLLCVVADQMGWARPKHR